MRTSSISKISPKKYEESKNNISAQKEKIAVKNLANKNKYHFNKIKIFNEEYHIKPVYWSVRKRTHATKTLKNKRFPSDSNNLQTQIVRKESNIFKHKKRNTDDLRRSGAYLEKFQEPIL